jgi:RNA polymerase sigma-70 factor (ECF subfamily)
VDEKLRSGPIEAPADFEVAFREHFAPVYRFIARRVGTDLAEDLAAEAFATAYRRRASYDHDRGSLRSWLFGIAANLVREHWRDEQQLLELDARLAPGGTRSFDDDADSRVVAAALAPRIAVALAALNREQRWPRVRPRLSPAHADGVQAGPGDFAGPGSPGAGSFSPPPWPSSSG